MGFFDLFKPKNKKSSTLFFHEDDFCQIELLPTESLSQSESQFNEIQKPSDKSAGYIGFQDIYIRPNNDNGLHIRNIPIQEFDNLLLKYNFAKSDNVVTGYAQSYRITAAETVGYGADYCALYYRFKNNVITHVWLTQPWNFDNKKLIPFLNEAGKKWMLVLIDWECTKSVNLTDLQAIEDYLS